MAVGNPYAPAFGENATTLPTAPAINGSVLGLGGIPNPGQVPSWQMPLLASTAGGGLAYPTFGEPAGIGGPPIAPPAVAAPAKPPAPAAKAPSPATSIPAGSTPGVSGSPNAGHAPTAGAGGGMASTPSTANDPTGGMAASADTVASANGGSSASNDTSGGSGIGSIAGAIGKGLLGMVPGIGPIATAALNLGQIANNIANPAQTPSQIAAQAAVNQAMADQGSAPASSSGPAPGSDAGNASTSGPGTQGGGGMSPGAASGADSAANSGGGSAGAADGGSSGNAGTAGSAGGGDAGGGGASAGAGPGAAGAAGGAGAGGDGGAGAGGAGGGAGGFATGGLIAPQDIQGRSPPPDVGYISARPGEYVVNAPMAQRYAGILELINAGKYDPANPPGVSGDTDMSGTGGAPFGASQQFGPSPTGGSGDNDNDDGSAATQAQMLAGPQDPANNSPLMPFPNSMALTPDAAMQRLTNLPTDQRMALAQTVADPTIQGALLMVLGPPFAQFLMAAQSAPTIGGGGNGPVADSSGAGGAAPPQGGPMEGGQQSMGPANIPSASSGAPGGSVSPGAGGPMPGPSSGFGAPMASAPPQMPHAMGGPVHRQDIRYMPPPVQSGAPPGVRPPMPQTGLRGVGMPGQRSPSPAPYQMPMSPDRRNG